MSKKASTKVLPTLVTFLIDRSGSMSSIWDSTIEGFNAYLKTMQESGDAIKFTRLQFDHHTGCNIQKDCVAEPISKVLPLDKQSYQPRGGTPLIEAAHKTIQAVEASLAKFDTKHQVVVCIQTDGEENQSGRDYSWAALKALVEAKIKEGWVFNFMGTGIDAYAQASQMGVPSSNTMSTGSSPQHVRESYISMSASNTRFASSGLVADSCFLASERDASGEHTIHHQPMAPAVDLSQLPNNNVDLTPGSSSPTSTSGGLDLNP